MDIRVNRHVNIERFSLLPLSTDLADRLTRSLPVSPAERDKWGHISSVVLCFK